jgi:hypothetical protein
MPEAEDVILDAAERACAAARQLWRRRGDAPGRPEPAFDAQCRRLSLLLAACFGVDPELRAVGRAPSAGWLARRLRGRRPGDGPVAWPITDGARIWLPCGAQVGDDAAAAELLRVMALVMGARLVRGSVDHCPSDSLTRDLFWAADGRIADAMVAKELPGLRPAVAHARQLALARRPPIRTLHGADHAVEAVLRTLVGAGRSAGRTTGWRLWRRPEAALPHAVPPERNRSAGAHILRQSNLRGMRTTGRCDAQN